MCLVCIVLSAIQGLLTSRQASRVGHWSLAWTAFISFLLAIRAYLFSRYQAHLVPLQGIDLVIKSVEAMVAPVANLEFAVFEKALSPQWQAVKSQFMSSNESIKDATRELIDVSFRSASIACNWHAQSLVAHL